MRLAALCILGVAACGRLHFANVGDSDGGGDAAHPGCVRGLWSGEDFSCAALTDGSVACWGNNPKGMLGDGTRSPGRTTPTTIAGLSGAIAIGGGFLVGCAVREDRTLWCWGDNAYQELGPTAANPQVTPIQIPGVADVVEIGGGGTQTCVRTLSGAIQCWGEGTHGQLGNGSTTSSATPVSVSGIPPAIQISAGAFHTCALDTDHHVWCWGQNNSGQLGVDTGGADSLVPIQVIGIPTAAMLVANLNQTCIAGTDGTAWCWGYNVTGQLGDNTTTNRTTPVQVLGVTDAVQIATGGFFSPGPGGTTCARDASGAVGCWGWNLYSQLGNGDTTDQHTRVPVTGIVDGDLLSTGLGHSCVRHASGELSCWGRNGNGQLGTGTTSTYTTPQTVLLNCP
jgi:alpha-tubulin suppressor-like RCC1 family protein